MPSNETPAQKSSALAPVDLVPSLQKPGPVCPKIVIGYPDSCTERDDRRIVKTSVFRFHAEQYHTGCLRQLCMIQVRLYAPDSAVTRWLQLRVESLFREKMRAQVSRPRAEIGCWALCLTRAPRTRKIGSSLMALNLRRTRGQVLVVGGSCLIKKRGMEWWRTSSE
ncbi:hypothetical protein BDN71DRAFT_1458032 [Pleurotus eryngii]|uniref:Uncharacterized protein n=1 Tax=Pleurotus eryngii TaxID=5323 RepID=A0A9P5ZIH4_PLEER|nr:hypothetical protein BDN71DRAFT_1458032 [Pleurotus eryngii]